MQEGVSQRPRDDRNRRVRDWPAELSPDRSSDLGIEYVPMMWGAKDAVPAFYEAQANWPETTKHVLFFNEPNDPGQSNISPEGAVQFWKQYMSPLKAQGYLIGMAATTSAPSGLEWVLKFKEVCPECWAETDFVPLHYYDVSVSVDARSWVHTRRTEKLTTTTTTTVIFLCNLVDRPLQAIRHQLPRCRPEAHLDHRVRLSKL
jgi:hypothetical protein